MNFFGDKVSKEAQLAALIDACVLHLQAVRYHPGIKADDRDRAVEQVQSAIPLIRRYLIYMRTQELEARK